MRHCLSAEGYGSGGDWIGAAVSGTALRKNRAVCCSAGNFDYGSSGSAGNGWNLPASVKKGENGIDIFKFYFSEFSFSEEKISGIIVLKYFRYFGQQEYSCFFHH